MFSLFGPNINRGVERYNETEGSALLDVRTKEEYAAGHIPGSINVTLDEIMAGRLNKIPEGKLFVYCLSGGRSSQATRILKNIGKNAENIGGIAGYSGELER
ncbi:rhodanese-like domain-containing protein [Eubacteriales bacterium KG127]